MKPFAITLGLALMVVVLPRSATAQTTIDKIRIPADFAEVKSAVPSGWKIEEEAPGDLNRDGRSDYAVTLVEDKPVSDQNGDPTERQRALLIVLATKDGKFTRAAVNSTLLQCTRCGGVFYGFVETPVTVSIEKGVLVVDQDHGSRNLTNLSYRFRYESATQKFALIGFDLVDADRLTAKVVSESTNYSTGVRVVTRSKGDRDIKSRSQIPKTKIYLENVDNEKFEAAAYKRLHL